MYKTDKEYYATRISYNEKGSHIKEKIHTGLILHLDGDSCFVYTLQTSLNTGLKKIE